MFKCLLPFFFPDPAYVLDTPIVVGIAFAAFVIGALLTGALWFIYSHTGRFSTCCSLIPGPKFDFYETLRRKGMRPACRGSPNILLLRDSVIESSTVNISCWSAARVLLFPVFECFEGCGVVSKYSQYNAWRRAGNSPCWAERYSQEKIHNLSIRCQELPLCSSLLIPVNLSEDVCFEQPVGCTLHRTSLFSSALLLGWWRRWPLYAMGDVKFKYHHQILRQNHVANVKSIFLHCFINIRSWQRT